MNEEELNEAMQYNLDYTEAMLSDELFGTNEVAEVKLLASEKVIKDLQQKVEQQEKELNRLNNIINELEEYIKPYLYMLNGIQDRDIYEQCQLDDFTDIMEKLQELKENNK